MSCNIVFKEGVTTTIFFAQLKLILSHILEIIIKILGLLVISISSTLKPLTSTIYGTLKILEINNGDIERPDWRQ